MMGRLLFRRTQPAVHRSLRFCRRVIAEGYPTGSNDARVDFAGVPEISLGFLPHAFQDLDTLR